MEVEVSVCFCVWYVVAITAGLLAIWVASG